jgi:hypothetical protein
MKPKCGMVCCPVDATTRQIALGKGAGDWPCHRKQTAGALRRGPAVPPSVPAGVIEGSRGGGKPEKAAGLGGDVAKGVQPAALADEIK